MSRIEPHGLTNAELVRISDNLIDSGALPESYQRELVNRLAEAGDFSTFRNHAATNSTQLELPL